MRKYYRSKLALCLAGMIAAAQLAGCGNRAQEAGNTPETAVSSEEAPTEAREESGKTDQTAGQKTVKLGEGQEKSIEYLPEDLDDGWDPETTTGIVLEESGNLVDGEGAEIYDKIVTINEGGTYVVSGVLEDGQILIDVDEDETVHLVFNGVELSNATTAPVCSSQKNKVIITLEDGTVNTISDGSSYAFEEDGEDEPDAPVFVRGDLTINGTGKLTVNGNYACGIRSKGNLKVISGDITVHSQSDGLKGKDSVAVSDGSITIQAGKDGIKSNRDDDDELGYIWIDGGQITIEAQDDGIQAETALIVNGGQITVTDSQEALAGKTVDILGGLIRANAQDDGINSAASVETEEEKRMDQEGVYTRIAGGEIWLDAMADGIDSNGDLYMEGGTLYLSGPVSGGDGILDYNGSASISGGTVFAAGMSGMFQDFGEDSAQNYLVVHFENVQEAGTTVTLTDADGKELGSYAPEKTFGSIIISCADLQQGSTYHVTAGDETVDLEVTGARTVYGTAKEGGMHGHMGGQRPEMPEGENGQKPERPEGENGQRPERAAGEGEKRPEGARGQRPAGEDGQRPDRAEGEDGQRPDRAAGDGRRPNRAAGDGQRSGRGGNEMRQETEAAE